MTQQQPVPPPGYKPKRGKSELQQRLESFESYLTSPKVGSQLARVLPNRQSFSQEIEMVKSTIRRSATENPTRNLLLCTRESLFAAVVQVFELGLKPVPALGHAYFIPFESRGKLICQLIIGYRGMIELARRSGVVSSIEAEAVHEHDYLRYELGDNSILKHVPYDVIRFSPEAREAMRGQPAATGPGPLVAAWCIVTMKDGGRQRRVVTTEYIQRIKKASRGSDRSDSPWKQWEDEMWTKTAIRHTLKFVPLSPEDQLVKAIDVDESAFSDIGRIVDTTGTDVATDDKSASGPKGNGSARVHNVTTTTAPSADGELPLEDADVGAETASGMDHFAAQAGVPPAPATDETPGDNPAQAQTNSAPGTEADRRGEPPAGDPPGSSEPQTTEGGDGAPTGDAPRRARRRRARQET